MNALDAFLVTEELSCWLSIAVCGLVLVCKPYLEKIPQILSSLHPTFYYSLCCRERLDLLKACFVVESFRKSSPVPPINYMLRCMTKLPTIKLHSMTCCVAHFCFLHFFYHFTGFLKHKLVFSHCQNVIQLQKLDRSFLTHNQ